MNKQGFTLYLTFLVTTVVFMLVTTSQTISRLSLNAGRSNVLETLVFHAADGGLEKGLAAIRKSFVPFELTYSVLSADNRTINVAVSASLTADVMNLESKVDLFEGKQLLISKTYVRNHIFKDNGRNGIGQFMEVR